MTCEVRNDGSRYPARGVERAALEDFSDPDSKDCDRGYEYNRLLGDLVVDLLGIATPVEDNACVPEEWQTIENAFLEQIGTELRVLKLALVEGLSCTDDGSCDQVTAKDCAHVLRGLARRVRVGAEVTQRLRVARWGHPAYGGGEGWEAKQAAAKASTEPSEESE